MLEKDPASLRALRAKCELQKSPCYKKRMNNIDELRSLSDDDLLRRLSNVLAQSRRVEWVLIAHIAEVDARRLYAREGWPSMYQYCVDVLHLSESEAYRRIAAARVSRSYPMILNMLEDGRLHLAGISLLRTHLTDSNYEEVLARATYKSKRDIEILVAELAPKPDVPPTIRKRPQPNSKSAPSTTSTVLCPDTVRQVAPAAKAMAVAVEKPAALEPLAPARYRVEFTASEELRDKLKRLEALMPGHDLADVLDAAVTEKLERLEAKRYGKTNKPRKSVGDADMSSGVRGIAAPVKRSVWERDRGQCTFISATGKRCPERHQLEFHHDEPYAFGGDRSPANIRLLCRVHNAYLAEKDFGKAKMDSFRVRETKTTWRTNGGSRSSSTPRIRSRTSTTRFRI
jgi:hypothetical protein